MGEVWTGGGGLSEYLSLINTVTPVHMSCNVLLGIIHYNDGIVGGAISITLKMGKIAGPDISHY